MCLVKVIKNQIMRRKIWIGVAIYFAIMTVVLTWPAILNLRDHVLGVPGDNLQFAWLIDWFDEALFEQFRSPYFVPQLNYPEGWNPARSETTPIQVILGAPFSRLGGTLFAYNAVALLSFAFTGFTTFIWVRHLTGGALPGLLAGTFYAFSPFRIAHYRAGHLNILGTMWFPLFFMGLFLVLTNLRTGSGESNVRHIPQFSVNPDTARGKWGAVLAGVALGLISLTSQHYFYLTLLVGGAASALFLGIVHRQAIFERRLWARIGLMGLAALPLAAAGTLPYLQLSQQGGLPERSVFAVSGGSASLSDFLLPSTDHFLFGSWVWERFSRDHWVEGTLYLGAAALALAVVGVWREWGNRKKRRTLVFLLLLATGGMVISLGTHFYWNEELVRVELPGWLAALLGRESTALPMPGYLLVKYLPFYDRMRTFKRAAALTLLGVSALAGMGASSLLNRQRGRSRLALGTVLLAVVLIDLYPGPFREFTHIEPRPVDHWLAAQQEDGAVAEFPFELEEDQLHVFYTLTHGKPFLGGFFNAFPPPQYQRIRPVMEEFPAPESINALADLGVRYILVHEDAYPRNQMPEERLRVLGLKLAFESSGVQVFLLESEPRE